MERPVGYEESSRGLQDGQVPDRHRLEQSRAYQLALGACERWREHLGLSDKMLRVEAWNRWQPRRIPGSGSVKPEWRLHIYAVPVLQRPIDWRYQLILARLMHSLAARAGVPWERSPDEVAALSLPTELTAISSKLMAS